MLSTVIPPVPTPDPVAVTLVTLSLNIVQSPEDNAPLFDAEAVGTCKVITTAAPAWLATKGVTVELKSVPLVPKVNSATEEIPVQGTLVTN